MLLHPLQFTLVQLYEGYWGLSRFAVRVRAFRALHYLKLQDEQEKLRSDAHKAISRTPKPSPIERASLLVSRDEAARLISSRPLDPDHFMPTRLGNVLRHYETAIGSPYGLNTPKVMPHLGLVAEPAHLAYLNDQRTLLDLSVRLSAMSFLASACLAACLWPYGIWLMASAVAYGFGYLFYRGAIASALHYGSALAAVVDLNRFALYKALGLGLPETAAQERERNKSLTALLEFHRAPNIVYRHEGALQLERSLGQLPKLRDGAARSEEREEVIQAPGDQPSGAS